MNAIYTSPTGTASRVGRPRKLRGPQYEGIDVTLHPSDIERMKQEVEAGAADSVSAMVCVAVSDCVRRLDKRRNRDGSESGSG